MADPNAPFASDEDLKRYLEIPESQVPTVNAPALLPLTQMTLRHTPLRTDEDFVQTEQRPGIPLQINPAEGELSTFSPWVRFQTARRQTMEDQQKYLESKFPGKVRRAKTSDDFIIEVNDPATGKPRDVLLNEQQMTLGDLAALGAEAPQVGLTVLAMALAGPLGGAARSGSMLGSIARAAAQLGLGATGYKMGQAGQEVETELEQGQKPDVGGILAKRAKEIPGQAALDAAAAGAFAVGSAGKRVFQGGPGMFQTPVEKEGLASAGRLAAKGAPKMSYSAAESSGMPLLAYLTAYAGAKPQSAAIVQEFKDAQQAETKAMMQWMTQRAGTDEQAGNELLDFLERNRGRQQVLLDRIRETMTEQERAALQKQLGKYGGRMPFDPSASGANFRQSVQGAYSGVKSSVNRAYENAYRLPGATDPDVPTADIANAIDRLRDRFPTTEGTQWLESLKTELKPNERYRDLVQRRSDLWNKIETSPADRGTKDYVFGQLSKAYTDLLDDAATYLKDPRFKSAIQRANSLVKTKELPFYQEGMADILRKAGERGSPENIELLNRFQNTDLYRRLVSVVGLNNPAVGHIKASVIDGLLGKSGTSALDPQWISGKELARNLQDLARNPNTREMFKDIFGNRGQSLLEQARVLQAMDGSLSKQEVEQVLAGGGPAASRRRLDKILAAQNQVDKVEAKRLLGAPAEYINPEDLANRYVAHLTESELRALSRRLQAEAPALHRQLQDKLTEQILGQAGTYRNISQSSLEKVLTDPKLEPKYRTLLGPDRFKDIEDFAKALGPRERADEIAKATGLLIKGESIGELSKVFSPGKTKLPFYARLMAVVPGWLGWKYAAYAINSGAFRKWASQGYPKGWGANITAGVISEPFLEDIATSSGSPRIVRDAVSAVKNRVEQLSKPEKPQPDNAPFRDEDELRKFLEAP